MKAKKVLSLLVCLLMAFGTACGGVPGDSSSSSSVSTDESTVSSEVSSDEVSSDEESEEESEEESSEEESDEEESSSEEESNSEEESSEEDSSFDITEESTDEEESEEESSEEISSEVSSEEISSEEESSEEVSSEESSEEVSSEEESEEISSEEISSEQSSEEISSEDSSAVEDSSSSEDSSDEPVGEVTLQKPAKQTWQYINRYDETVMDAYLRPIWYTREVYDEAALIIGETGWTTLLYTPDTNYEVVVRDYHLNKTYVEGVDFKIEGNKLIRLAGGSLPYMAINQYVANQQVGAYALPFDASTADSQLGNVSGYTHLAYYPDGALLDYHLNVSYRTNEDWDGYVPTSQQKGTEKFINKLKTQKQGQILFYGDSITFGCDATGHLSGGNANPYLPRWSELVTEWMARQYDADIRYLNGAVGGWTTNDGVNYWNQIHTSSQMGQNNQIPANYMATTDLLVLAFGMNDATNNAVATATYKQNIRTMINNYLSANPNGEVLLMSCMLPNTQSSWYTQNGWHDGVESALYQVASEYTSVSVAPITSMFKSFETQGKMTRDVLANNINHPNDFGVRVYAQTILKTIAGDVYGLERYGVGTLPEEAEGYEEKALRQPDPVLNPVADRKANVTYKNITKINYNVYSSQGCAYARFFDTAISTSEGQYFGKDAGVSSKTDVDMQNFAKQLIYNDRYIFSDYCQMISQGLPTSGNYNVAFQKLDGGLFKRGDSITIPKGAIYEYDSNGDGTIDYAWIFADTFKLVYNPAPCAQTAGCTNDCSTDLWHVYKETEEYTYHINAVSIFTGASSANQVSFFFSDNGICDINNQTVDLGYTGWTPSDADTSEFLKYIKINDTAITSLFPNAYLQGFDQKAGLSLTGITLKAGDRVSIDKGAVFRHNGMSMVMDYTFTLTYNSGTSFTASKA